MRRVSSLSGYSASCTKSNRYGKLTIEEGGELSGEVGTLSAAEPAPRKEQRPLAAKPLAGLP